MDLTSPYPNPLLGRAGFPRKHAEARGSLNSVIRPRIRIFPGITVLELRVAVPDAPSWTRRKLKVAISSTEDEYTGGKLVATSRRRCR